MTQDALIRHCRQEAETATLAQQFGAAISQFLQSHPGTHLNIALEGDLGAGKTTFARHCIQGLGFTGRVKSPTYTLCEPYLLQLGPSMSTRITAYHFDLYRMRSALEWQEAGFAEHFDEPGFCLIEWPGKAEGTLPPFDLVIQMQAGVQEDERTIDIKALSSKGQQLLYKIDHIDT
jgi:tRNA threonylcarbamoyladenosine biosynthesis protein TsaE